METEGGGIQSVKGARNQALWREVNERIKNVAETAADVEFLCECADLDCVQTLNLSIAEYERIRSSPVQFPVALGHVYKEIEDVIQQNDRFVVVEKKGKAGEVAAKLDPGSRA
jgi:hypothetical protein